MIDFDRILDHIGHMGRSQLLLCAMVYWLGFPYCMQITASLFFVPHWGYRCRTPPLDDPTVYPKLTEMDILNLTAPHDPHHGGYDTCHRYGFDLALCNGTLDCVNKSSEVIPCDEGYVFDHSIFTSTVTEEWQLMCDNALLGMIEASVSVFGPLVGSFAGGYSSDRFGRKLTMLAMVVSSLVFGVVQAVTPWVWLFIFARYMVGLSVSAGYMTAYIYAMEITGKDKRKVAALGMAFSFSIGYLLNSGLASLLHNWRHFFLAISLLPAPYLIFNMFVPECPRWHFAYLRDEIGKLVSIGFARQNGKLIPQDVWQQAASDAEDSGEPKIQQNYSMLTLMKNPGLRKITLILLFSGYAANLAYFAMLMNIGMMHENVFIHNALHGILDIVNLIIIYLTLDRLGRRILIGALSILAGIFGFCNAACVAIGHGHASADMAASLFQFAGLRCIQACLAVHIIYAMELFPTVLRGIAVGFIIMVGGFGSTAAPFLMAVQGFALWLPNVIWAVMVITAGVFLLRLPETANRTLPETMEDAAALYSKSYPMPLINRFRKSKEEPNGESVPL